MVKEGVLIMTVEKIFNLDGLVDDNTEIFIRDMDSFRALAHGNWYQDNVLEFSDHEVEGFTWQDDNKLYVDVK